MKAPRFKTRVYIRAEYGEIAQVCDPRTGALAAAIHPDDGEYRTRRIRKDGKVWLVLLLKRDKRLRGLPLHHEHGCRSWQRAWEDACIEISVMRAGRPQMIQDWCEL